MIDAHAHVWALARGDYDWLTPAEGILYRDHSVTELINSAQSAKVRGAVLVQAAPTLAETHWMLALAQQNSFVRGVVGWTDLQDFLPEPHPLLVGVRAMPQDRRGLGFDDSIFDCGFARIAERDIVFDAVCEPAELIGLAARLRRSPGLRVVLDHAGCPDRSKSWPEDLARIADAGGWCKLSGLVTLPALTSPALLDDTIDTIIRLFGTRLLWGSDWPVVTLACDYQLWVTQTLHCLRHLPGAMQQCILELAAMELYRLEDF